MIEFEGGTLSQEHFIQHWPAIQEELENNREMWEDYFTKESLYEDIMEARIQVWGFGLDGKLKIILFTRLVEYPTGRVLHVMMGFGNLLDRLLPHVEATLENFGRVMGCKLCEVIGREGWERKLSHRFRKRGVVLVADIPQDAVN